MAEFSSAGIKFTIGGSEINGCYSTPDMGGEPEKIDVSSFDQKKYKKYIQGLMELPTLQFDFFDSTVNYTTALNAESDASKAYSLTYPDGSGYTWTGTHRTFKLGAAVGDAIKFRIVCTAAGELTPKTGTEITGGTETD